MMDVHIALTDHEQIVKQAVVPGDTDIREVCNDGFEKNKR